MKIKYKHVSDPNVEKVHDTEKSLEGCYGVLRLGGGIPSIDEWDQFTLDKFEEDKQRGIILSYEVVKE